MRSSQFVRSSWTLLLAGSTAVLVSSCDDDPASPTPVADVAVLASYSRPDFRPKALQLLGGSTLLVLGSYSDDPPHLYMIGPDGVFGSADPIEDWLPAGVEWSINPTELGLQWRSAEDVADTAIVLFRSNRLLGAVKLSSSTKTFVDRAPAEGLNYPKDVCVRSNGDILVADLEGGLLVLRRGRLVGSVLTWATFELEKIGSASAVTMCELPNRYIVVAYGEPPSIALISPGFSSVNESTIAGTAARFVKDIAPMTDSTVLATLATRTGEGDPELRELRARDGATLRRWSLDALGTSVAPSDMLRDPTSGHVYFSIEDGRVLKTSVLSGLLTPAP